MRIVLAIILLFYGLGGAAQKRDSAKSGVIDRLRETPISQKTIRSLRAKPEADTVFNYKSEEAFLPYEGWMIRKIIIQTVHFNRTVQDTTRVFKNLVIKAGEKLHTDTRERVIRNNLFIKEGEPLNPYRVADNERFLRDLDFIKDSRIHVIHADSVARTLDLLVMPRDVFSLGASLEPKDIDQLELKIQEANLLGQALKIQYLGDYDATAAPQLSSEWLFQSRNMLGSFTNVTLARTNINTGRSLGLENEQAVYFRMERPLFMPYARWAGGLELSSNESVNRFLKPDTLFAQYKYQYNDVWAGFTFGQSRVPRRKLENRNRKFFSVRFLDQHFVGLPSAGFQLAEPNLYVNRRMALAKLTFFRQDFYKTKYVFGFGRTEDIPYGYQLAITGGMERLGLVERPYLAVEYTESITDRAGNILSINSSLAGYRHQGSTQDVLLRAGTSYFSKVYEIGPWNLRHSLEFGYQRFADRSVTRPLDINGANGLQGFNADSLRGDESFRLRAQLLLFTSWKLLGFHFALVPQYDLGYLNKVLNQSYTHKTLHGFSLGIRTRNENLIFNTFELRGYYFPKTVGAVDTYRIELRSNLRIKYPTNLIRSPTTVFE